MKKLTIIVIFIINLFAVDILVLHSYSPNLAWTTTQSRVINKTLLKNVNNPNLYIEFMYTKRFTPTPKRCEKCLLAIEEKYKNVKFDIIITTDDNALNFVRKFKNAPQFKDAKIFFEGVNNLKLAKILDKNLYAGVFEKKNPLSNLNIALKIKPNLKTIYIISDKTTSGNKTINQYKTAFKNINDINLIYINSSKLNNILDKLKNYDKNSIMMLLTFAGMRKNGNYIPPTKFAQEISKIYNEPILVHNDVYTNIPNTNIVGGDVTDAKQQATLNAKKIFQYLNGTPMKDIGFTLKGANQIYLNVKNLQKFGVDAYSLGIKNAIYVNVPTSFYEIYKIEIISFIIIMILLFIFIAILANKNRILSKYSKEIQELNSDLEIKIQKEIESNRKKEQILFQQSKLAAMGEMIGAIAHQWRQPLNSIGLNIQLLVDDFLDNRVDEKYILNFEEKQMETIKFMSKTIDDFRNFFNQDKEKQLFSLKDSVEEVIKIVDKQLQNNNIHIILNADNSEILGYKNEFKQVVLNLINNAKDAIIQNKVKDGQIEITIKDKKIFIKDNGGGIPQNIQERIFEPYFTTKDQGKGTGIGLYMSKIIIEEHFGGKLTFENKDNGVEFIINLEETK